MMTWVRNVLETKRAARSCDLCVCLVRVVCVSEQHNTDRSPPWEPGSGPDGPLRPDPKVVVRLAKPPVVPARVALHGVPESSLGFDASAFCYFAKHYELMGGTIAELCSHNSRVAATIRHHELAQTWKIVGMLYAGADMAAAAGARPSAPHTRARAHTDTPTPLCSSWFGSHTLCMRVLRAYSTWSVCCQVAPRLTPKPRRVQR